jgi:cytoskeleton protein RodZ
MAFEDMNDIEPVVEEAGPPPEESNNRAFLIVAGILGAITLIALLCLAAFAFFRLPAVQAQRATDVARERIQSTEAALAVQLTAQAQVWTPTFTATQPATPTPEPPTPTPVVAQPVSPTPTIGPDPRTATVAALLTQAAAAQTTVPTGITPTILPQGGFADDVGAPGLLALAVLLVGVIFLARRMRTAH